MPKDMIAELRARNRRVEADKAWETSGGRKLIITLMIYAVATIYMYVLGIEMFWAHAFIPAVGFVLSTLTMPWFKKMWMRYWYPRRR